jgi:hypothetical protein
MLSGAGMESLVPPGEVFASLPYAALLAASSAHGLRCRYSGRLPSPGHGGFVPVYALAP